MKIQRSLIFLVVLFLLSLPFYDLVSAQTNTGIEAQAVLSNDAFVFLPFVKAVSSGPVETGTITIINIFYDGAGRQEPDEYVEIRNDDSTAIQLSGWELADIVDHVFTFPNYVIAPGQVCRIYTNQLRPEWCGFSYGNGSAIWNNSGDTATLRDKDNNLVDEYTYP